MKCKKIIVIFLILTFLVCGIITFCLMITKNTVDVSGFGVDENGYVYLGKSERVEVFDGQRLIRKLDIPETARGYNFIMEPNDTMVFETGIYKSVYDLDGNLIERVEADGKIAVYHWKDEEFVTKDGRKYRYKNFLGYYSICEITEDGDVVITHITNKELLYLICQPIMAITGILAVFLLVSIDKGGGYKFNLFGIEIKRQRR